MKKVRIAYINKRPPVLSNKEMLMLEREKEYFQDDDELNAARERRMKNRVSASLMVRK